MISWMQKNNKFLIVTIWIATISFIFTGATYGFSYGLKSNSIGQVGEIELNRDRFHMEYQNLYSQYNQMFQGKFDEEQAKQMRLQEQVIQRMASQAKILNLAKEFGIVVSDQELGQEIAKISSFQKDGKFNKSIYENYLQNSRLSANTFEESLRDGLTIQKTFELLHINGTAGEYTALTKPFEIGDQIKYITLSTDDVNITTDDQKLKEYWDVRKDQYQTSKQYVLDIVWTKPKEENISTEELKSYYEKNSFNYIGQADERLSFDEAKEQVTSDVKLQRSKKSANKQFIAFKKGEIEKEETITYDTNDFRLPRDVWETIEKKSKGEVLKPKVVNSKYATIKISDIIEPRLKTFEEAKDTVTQQYKSEMENEQLSQLAESKLTSIDNEEGEVSVFLTLNNIEKQKIGLNQQETANFTSKLFTSDQEKGIISIGNKAIVYKIIDQKIITIDQNQTDEFHQKADQLKRQAFETNLIKILDAKYPTEIYK